MTAPAPTRTKFTELSARERAAVLGGTAARLYQFELATPEGAPE